MNNRLPIQDRNIGAIGLQDEMISKIFASINEYFSCIDNNDSEVRQRIRNDIDYFYTEKDKGRKCSKDDFKEYINTRSFSLTGTIMGDINKIVQEGITKFERERGIYFLASEDFDRVRSRICNWTIAQRGNGIPTSDVVVNNQTRGSKTLGALAGAGASIAFAAVFGEDLGIFGQLVGKVVSDIPVHTTWGRVKGCQKLENKAMEVLFQSFIPALKECIQLKFVYLEDPSNDNVRSALLRLDKICLKTRRPNQNQDQSEDLINEVADQVVDGIVDEEEVVLF